MPQQWEVPQRYLGGEYLEYQRRYATEIRESDKVLLDLLAQTLREERRCGASLLDIGCSTGNFLRHAKHGLPGLELHGADLLAEPIDRCRRDPELSGVSFDVFDIRRQAAPRQYDFIVMNAVLHSFGDEPLDRAIEHVSRSLVPGGWFFAFALVTPFNQDVDIFERSVQHADGVGLRIHSERTLNGLFGRYGFDACEYRPFQIPIELTAPQDLSDMRSYTISSDTGGRLLFRGCVFQPWCHFRVRKG